MGLRPQAMRLAFVPNGMPGRFLAPELSLQDMLDRQVARFETAVGGSKVHYQSHVGEIFSLIYAPFYTEGRVIDAVLNRPVSGPVPDTFMNGHPASDPPEWQMRLLSALCPSCGWDLAGERNALVLTCSNCNSAWQPVGNSLKQVPAGFIPDNQADLYLPFWRIKADVSGVSLNSYADLIRLANLPRVIRKNWEQIPFRFWSLAFRLSPKSFLSLSVQLNLTQPRVELKSGIPPGRLHPATLPVADAVDTLKISLAGMMKPAETVFPKLPQIHIRPSRVVLVYIPFRSGQFEWIQENYCISVNKNMLALTDH